jgi:SAM-dependent methyltransferase
LDASAALAYTLEDQRRMAKAKNYFAWQARLALPELGQRVIEVGCGTGNFTGALLDRELAIAIDVEPECVARLKARYPDRANLRTAVCEPGSATFAELASLKPDSCVCLNVLEHIDDDLGALRAMSSVLAPGGRIVLLVPAFPALYGAIDRNLGHRRRYRRADLMRLANFAGLHVRKADYVNASGFFGWWINSHVLRREVQSEGQIALFDRWIVPVQSRLEAAVRPPFGQSLFAVLEK